MGTKGMAQRYRAAYARLLRLYPRSFRERFGEAMTQTFFDACRDHQNSPWALGRFGLSAFFETSREMVRENMRQLSHPGKTMLRVALGALALLMVPLAASQVVEGWNWNPGAFVFLYVLLCGLGMAYALIASKMSAWSYKAGVGLALAAGFALGWSNMVHVADSENPANLAYYSVLLVGGAGAALARLEARGLARTLFAMAGVLSLIALLLPSGAPPDLARNMAIGHAVLAALFTASGLLFRQASSADSK